MSSKANVTQQSHSVNSKHSSAPPRTKSGSISNSSSNSHSPNTNNNTKIITQSPSNNNLLDSRNKKLIELYCVSRLSELLNIKDENDFRSELNSFLNKNDIRKNRRFQATTLPHQNHINILRQRQSSPLFTTTSLKGSLRNARRRSISTSSIQTMNNNNNHNHINKNVRSKSIVTSTTPSIVTSRAKSTSPDKNIVANLNTKKLPDSKRVGDSSFNNAGIRPIVQKQTTNSTPNLRNNSESIDNVNFKIMNAGKRNAGTMINGGIKPKNDESISNENENDNDNNEPAHKKNKVHFEDVSYNYDRMKAAAMKEPPLIRTAYYIDPNMKPPQTTPVTSNNNLKTPLIKDLTLEKEQRIEQTDGYVSDNINTKDLVYLLMKENVPSKVAQAIPLAELRYMAQTLPLINLIPRTHKVLTTELINNALNEARITVVSSRIEELKRLGLWSLRQPKKFIDPWNNTHTYRQTLLDEAKWMQADFDEGKKYKIAVCTTIAQAVMDYWNYGDVCCINTKSPHFLTDDDKVKDSSTEELDDVKLTNNTEENQKMKDIKSDNDTNKITIPDNIEDIKNADTLEDNEEKEDKMDVIGGEEEQVVADEVTDKKRMEDDKSESHVSTEVDSEKMTTPGEVSDNDVNSHGQESDEKTIDISKLLERPDPSQDITPKSLPKFSLEEYEKSMAERKIKPFKLQLSLSEFESTERNIADQIPIYMGVNKKDEVKKSVEIPFAPISKSVVTLEDDDFYKLIERQLVEDEQSLVQLSKRRGMFYGNRRSHYLRPPPVPSLRYLQNRTPTIWLPEDDQELVRNINTYAYNWELISANMIHRSSKSYLSNIERRTPWQCFERFVQLNEKFNFNDLKGPRAHSAQQWLIEAHKFQQRQNRRISPLGVGNESIQRGHRRLRWASMFEVMRRCIKKRENAPRPNPTQPRKPLDCKNMKIPTPSEMSQLKAQRDEALRRDIQLRRNAKNRLQQKQIQAAQNQSQGQNQAQALNQAQTSNSQSQISIQLSRGASRNTSSAVDGTESSNSTATANNSTRQQTGAAGQYRYTEEEIIELYARKIQLQKPNLSPETALQAAKSYYKTLKYEQQQQQQQQQAQAAANPSQQGSPANSNKTLNVPNSTVVPKREASTGVVNDRTTSSESIASNANKIKSPTPHEILQRFQK
ncbi:chromatin modification- protein VID21 [Monosporozyma unispora]|nr:chromatin modification- protein VID21 [Kazachstania unispora]